MIKIKRQKKRKEVVIKENYKDYKKSLAANHLEK